MQGFIGRGAELSRLERIWEDDGNRAVAVYGRRRIGKSTLLRRFCQGKRSIYIECVIGSVSDNIHVIHGAVSALEGIGSEDPPFLKDAFDEVLDSCRREKTAVVFDEVPYMLESGQQVGSSMQHLVDAIIRETDSVIIICGSSMSVMNRETTKYNKPLYGRFSERIRIGPLSYSQCRSFHPTMGDMDFMRLYLTLGGIPKFHLDGTTDTYRGYIEMHFLSEDADMADEGEVLITAEFSPVGRYMAVINAISDGSTSLKTISEKAGMQRTMCSRCIEDLQSVGIIGEEVPMMDAPKRSVYRILDPLTAFCQGIVRESKRYTLRDPSDVYDMLSSRIDTFLGTRFEDLCSGYVMENYDCIGCGKWWGVDSEKVTHEVDIVAVVKDGASSYGLFGECKFRKRPMPLSVYRELQEDVSLIRTDLTRRYILFSISGFTDELEEVAGDEGVVLVGPGELMG